MNAATAPFAAPVARPLNVSHLVRSIWTVRGSLPLDPALSRDEALARLEPLLDEYGTRTVRLGDTLTYSKTDPAAQDPLATFDEGSLAIEETPGGLALTWRLVSKTLLACFFAPLFFLAFAQAAAFVADREETAAKSQDKADKKKPEPVLYQNPIDKALGAPAPEKPKEDKKKEGGRGKGLSPTPGYVFAGIFALLYVVGRWMEPRLARRRFLRALEGA